MSPATGVAVIVDLTLESSNQWLGLILTVLAIGASVAAVVRSVNKCFTGLHRKVDDVKNLITQEAQLQTWRHEANLERFERAEAATREVVEDVESLKSVATTNTAYIAALRGEVHNIGQPGT